MQQTMTKTRWGILAVLLAAFALAISLATAQSAMADDLTAGNADLDEAEATMEAQATEATSWPLGVYIQHGSGEATLVKSYTKDEFTLMASESEDYVAGLHWDGSSWYVTTAVAYVTLEDLLENAGVQWGKGATLTFENTESKESGSFKFEDVEKLYFYPDTARTVRSTENGVQTGVVFGLKNTKAAIIGDSSTAADVEKVAETSSKVDEAVLPVMGSLKDEYDKLSGKTVEADRFVNGINKVTITFSEDKATMYRLYNPNTGEHFFTASTKERDEVKDAGWNYEGEAWNAPVISNTPVYRVYNPNAGDHHYTTSAEERDGLVALGWTDEGIGWYSDDAKAVPLYRLYNPNAEAGAHHFTTSTEERDGLVKAGWNNEDIGWYGLAASE